MHSPSHLYQVPGIYTVTLTVSGSGGTDTLARPNYVTVLPPVEASFVATPTTGAAPLTVSFANISTGDDDAALWEFGDGASSMQTHPVHVYEEPGSCTVTLTVSGLGSEDTETKPGYISAWRGFHLPVVLRFR